MLKILRIRISRKCKVASPLCGVVVVTTFFAVLLIWSGRISPDSMFQIKLEHFAMPLNDNLNYSTNLKTEFHISYNHPTKKMVEKDTAHTKVLLITYYRGGSSFLGSMFGQNPKAFYWFEPLHAHGKWRSWNGTKLSSTLIDVRLKVLQQAFACNATSMDDVILGDMFFKSGHHMPKFSKYTHCLKENRYLRTSVYKKCSTLLDSSCNASDIIAVKIIRFTMNLVPQLLQWIPDLRVIHYVRDPRGIIASRADIHKYTDTFLVKKAQELCHMMSENQKEFEKLDNPENHFLLKYENLGLDPKNTSEDLYAFLSHEYPDNLKGWIVENTQAKSNDTTFEVRRNSKETVFKWQKTLSVAQIKNITDACIDVLRTFKYQIYFPIDVAYQGF